jgi:hypothetical protein
LVTLGVIQQLDLIANVAELAAPAVERAHRNAAIPAAAVPNTRRDNLRYLPPNTTRLYPN